ncbi:MAG: DHA2 family efflux MFS transporter permease subunit [Terriglobales bacterium]
MATVAAYRREVAVNPWIIAVSVMLGTFMEVLDTTVVNVSLPHIAGNLGATVEEATWVLTSYLVANAIVLPMTGWLANRFGRKRILMISIGGFTVSSLLCGIAPNLESLLLFRVVQGATGGGLQPLSQAIMLEAFPPSERGRAMAFWGLGIVVAPMLGPVLGGWITDSYSWRWLFYINLPVGALGLLMSQMFVFDPHYIQKERGRIDYWGIGLLVIGMGSLQIMLDKGQQEDWFSSDLIVTLTVLAAVGLGAFIVNEFMRAHPIVNLRVFRIRTYATGVFLMTVLGFVLYGSTVLIPIFLQTLLGYSALDAGVAMLPRGLGSFLAMPLVGVLMSKIEARKLLTAGLLVAAFSLWMLARINLNAGYWDIFWPQFIQGVSMGFIFVPLTTTTHDPIPKEQMGNATSIFNVMRNIGGSVGIAVVTTIVARTTQANINILGRNVTPYSESARQLLQGATGLFMGGGSAVPLAENQAYGAVFGMVARQAAMLANIHAFRLLALIFLCATPLILLMRRPRHQGGGGAAMH